MFRLTVAVVLGTGLGWLAVGTAGRSPATCQLRGVLPDPHCTPGVGRALSTTEVCQLRSVPGLASTPLTDLVYGSYGIRAGDRGSRYHMQELIPRQLGGLLTSRNLWPEPVSGRAPPEAKHALDERLQALVCARRLSLRTAQERLTSNWVATYEHMRERGRPGSRTWRKLRTHSASPTRTSC
jgi:hypothetical protein